MVQILDWSNLTNAGVNNVIADRVDPANFAGTRDPIIAAGGPTPDGTFGRSLAAEFQLNNNLATWANNAYYQATAGGDPTSSTGTTTNMSWRFFLDRSCMRPKM
jgi:hypothetical protein